MTPTLPAIAALVRSGAVERGWALFEAGGYLDREQDPAALAVKGRLLKARGRLAGAGQRRRLLAEAAAAYGAAHALSPAPYLAINAASLHLLAGNPGAASAGAAAVLTLLDAPEPPTDTPYFLAATRAEALLLLGDRAGAQAALDQALRHDPDGWDDRATTIVQLREVLAQQRQDVAWLDAFAPPASLHFAGHMGFASGGASEAALAAQLDGWLAQRTIGFAWGALAAGADIVIAEALLQRGVEIHVVLPCPPDAFEPQSVAPAGMAWSQRYRTLMAAAASIHWAGPNAASVHDPLATAHAGELAIGGAVLQAARLGTAARQLIVLDEAGGGTNTARQAELWRAELGEQTFLEVSRQLALHVAIGIDALRGDSALTSLELAALAHPIGLALSALPAGLVRASPGLWEFAAADLDQGLAAVQAVLAASGMPPSVGVHIEIAPVLTDPASGLAIAYGPAPDLARRLMEAAPAGVALASDSLAVTLASRAPGPYRSELYLPDAPELGGAAHLLLPRG
jgi:hypothetical protein